MWFQVRRVNRWAQSIREHLVHGREGLVTKSSVDLRQLGETGGSRHTAPKGAGARQCRWPLGPCSPASFEQGGQPRPVVHSGLGRIQESLKEIFEGDLKFE